jgi:hypothetical protein
MVVAHDGCGHFAYEDAGYAGPGDGAAVGRHVGDSGSGFAHGFKIKSEWGLLPIYSIIQLKLQNLENLKPCFVAVSANKSG